MCNVITDDLMPKGSNKDFNKGLYLITYADSEHSRNNLGFCAGFRLL